MANNKARRATGKTLNALAEVTAALKTQYLAQRKAKEHRQLDREVRKGNEYVPNKGTTKGAGPMTKGTPNAYGANVLRACPGGARDEARTGAYAAYLKQIDHPETGCIVVHQETAQGQATLDRLANSPKNANTTRGNYSHSVVH